MRISFEQCKNLLNNANKIALFCHIRPDGDTLGAALGLKLALQKIGKVVEVFCEDVLPEKFLKLGFDGYFNTQLPRQTNDFDLFVAIDCGDIGRMGCFGSVFLNHKKTLSIDHHVTHEDFSKNTYVLDVSSTCEIILQIINSLYIAIDTQLATVLFIGLSTDTGNFRHSNTNKNTFLAAQQLSLYGVDIAGINRKLYNETTFARLKLLGRSLSNMRKFFDGKLCIMFVTAKDFKDTATDMSFTEGFTDYAISVDTAQIGVCISQSNANSYKVSMRSKGIDVAEICGYFGGGGHTQAAGCVLCGFLEDVIDKIVRVIEVVKWMDL